MSIRAWKTIASAWPALGLLALAQGCVAGAVKDAVTDEALNGVAVTVTNGICRNAAGSSCSSAQRVQTTRSITGHFDATYDGVFVFDADGNVNGTANKQTLAADVRSGQDAISLQFTKRGYQTVTIWHPPKYSAVTEGDTTYAATVAPTVYLCPTNAVDTDADGICDAAEARLGTDPRSAEIGEPLTMHCNNELSPTGEGQHQWGSSYLHWTSQGAGIALEQRVRILQPALDSFHTHQFSLTGASDGYIGLQARSIDADGTIATHVRFSIWNTLAAEGVACTTFGGEGVGHTCVIDPYPVTMGTFYTLRIQRAESDATGTWWEATATDDLTSEARRIGRIKVAHTTDRRLIYSNLNFSEYFGPRARDCRSVPQSIAEWMAPEITDEEGNTRADPFELFRTASPAAPCTEAGVQASGKIRMLGNTAVYRMINGSVQMCE